MTYADELEKYANSGAVAVFFLIEVKLQEMAEGSTLCSLPTQSVTLTLSSPSNILHAYFKCHPPCAVFSIFFFKVHPPVTGFQLQLLLVSLLSEKSASLEAFYQNLLQQGGRLKLSGMTCGLDGAGGRGV